MLNICRHLPVTLFGCSIIMSMSTPGSTYILSMWSIFHYNFHLQDNHIFSLKQTIVFSTFYFLPVKGSASGCCLVFTYFLGKFSLVLLIKMYLLKESIYFTRNLFLDSKIRRLWTLAESCILYFTRQKVRSIV